VDRRALPAPMRPTTQGQAYLAPRDQLDSCWLIVATALALEQVGVADNFFELGVTRSKQRS